MSQVKRFQLTLDIEISADTLGKIGPTEVRRTVVDLLGLPDRDYTVWVDDHGEEREVDMRVSAKEAA
jgi:hypothetical protein